MENTKLFNAFEDRASIRYRPGTSDEAIIKAVIIDRTEYAFPKFEPKIIFDIGANIGVVSVVLANVYPDAKIYSFEPVLENFTLLAENVSHYKNITPKWYGLGRESGKARIYHSEDPTNLGGFSNHIKHGDGLMVHLTGISEVCKEFGVPDLIKIDTEGAEYDILTNMPNLDKVKWICGELHGVRDYALLDHLSKDFHLHFSRFFHDKVWHFSALSKEFLELNMALRPNNN